MRLLFDSSAIIALCGRRNMDRLLEGWTLDLALYEVGNAVWKQVYLHKNLTTDEGRTALDALAGVVERIRKTPVEDPLRVLELAVAEGITYYDAAYLHAALKDDKTLVTDDENLHTVAKKYVETLTSDEL